MKLLLGLLLLTGYAAAQSPASLARRDTLPKAFPPEVNSPDQMPNARPNNTFYRYLGDSKNVVRATLDNMPVKVPDSTISYPIGQMYQRYSAEPPAHFLEPMPRIIPKRFW